MLFSGTILWVSAMSGNRACVTRLVRSSAWGPLHCLLFPSSRELAWAFLPLALLPARRTNGPSKGLGVGLRRLQVCELVKFKKKKNETPSKKSQSLRKYLVWWTLVFHKSSCSAAKRILDCTGWSRYPYRFCFRQPGPREPFLIRFWDLKINSCLLYTSPSPRD